MNLWERKPCYIYVYLSICLSVCLGEFRSGFVRDWQVVISSSTILALSSKLAVKWCAPWLLTVSQPFPFLPAAFSLLFLLWYVCHEGLIHQMNPPPPLLPNPLRGPHHRGRCHPAIEHLGLSRPSCGASAEEDWGLQQGLLILFWSFSYNYSYIGILNKISPDQAGFPPTWRNVSPHTEAALTSFRSGPGKRAKAHKAQVLQFLQVPGAAGVVTLIGFRWVVNSSLFDLVYAGSEKTTQWYKNDSKLQDKDLYATNLYNGLQNRVLNDSHVSRFGDFTVHKRWS